MGWGRGMESRGGGRDDGIRIWWGVLETGFGPLCTSMVRENPLPRMLPGILIPTRVDLEKFSTVSTSSSGKESERSSYNAVACGSWTLFCYNNVCVCDVGRKACLGEPPDSQQSVPSARIYT